MQKEKPNKRVTIWGQIEETLPFKGRTAVICSEKIQHFTFGGKGYKVLFDGWTQPMFFFEDELYFYDHPLGYNQKCFS